MEQLSRPEAIAGSVVRQTTFAGARVRNGTVWLRLTVMRPAKAAPMWLLDLCSPILNDVAFYVPVPAAVTTAT